MKILGKRLDREVRMALLDELPELDGSSLFSDASVFIWMEMTSLDSSGQLPKLDSILDHEPMALYIGGQITSTIFYVLNEAYGLRYSQDPTIKHVMTATLTGTPIKCIEDFFLTANPAEERWDDWRGYSIISPTACEAKIVKATELLLD
jgi:hypothetical protein